MAKNKAGDGSNCPRQNAELEGKICTAAQSTMADADYSRGYPIPSTYLHMENLGPRKGSK